MRDDEVIAAANERGVAMVFTGVRHFRHCQAGVKLPEAARARCWRSSPASSPARRATGTAAPPKAEQRIYFANHQSHFDWVLIWAALPRDLRAVTRPIAARDYWTATPLKHWITREIFNAVYVSRAAQRTTQDPLEPLMEALAPRRLAGHLSRRARAATPATRRRSSRASTRWPQAFPEVQLIPAWIDNVQRVMPKGEVVPVPILCTVDLRRADRAAAGRGRARLPRPRPRARWCALRERRLMGSAARSSSVSQQVGLLFVIAVRRCSRSSTADRLQPLAARARTERAGRRAERFARELRAVWLGALLFWVAWVVGRRSSRRCCSASSRSSRCASS